MLVLNRRVGERILIGRDIVIMPVRIGEGSVRIGIEAPHSVNIIREEVGSVWPGPVKPIQLGNDDLNEIGRRA